MMTSGEEDARPVEGKVSRKPRNGIPVPRKAALTSAAVFVLVAAAALVIPLLARDGGDPTPQPGAVASERGVSFGVGCRAGADDTCARVIADLGRRAPLSSSQRARAESDSERVLQALPPGEPAPSCSPQDDVCRMLPAPPSPQRIREALVAAGFAEVVVRIARADDPAPTGGVLAAVGADEACIIVSNAVGDVRGHIAGRLPGGTCLLG